MRLRLFRSYFLPGSKLLQTPGSGAQTAQQPISNSRKTFRGMIGLRQAKASRRKRMGKLVSFVRPSSHDQHITTSQCMKMRVFRDLFLLTTHSDGPPVDNFCDPGVMALEDEQQFLRHISAMSQPITGVRYDASGSVFDDGVCKPVCFIIEAGPCRSLIPLEQVFVDFCLATPHAMTSLPYQQPAAFRPFNPASGQIKRLRVANIRQNDVTSYHYSASNSSMKLSCRPSISSH